jgi:uncharacterized protein YdeI (YjbR/CyaY-like superfamily)
LSVAPKPDRIVRFTPKSRRSWRNWLAKNHNAKTEIWLVFFKRHTGKPTISYGDAVEEAICFGWIDGVKRSIDDERYMHRFSPRVPNSRWSALNRKRAELMTSAGLMTKPGEKAIRRAKRNGKWDEPAENVDFSMPQALADELQRNKRAAAYFESLAASYQRQFIAWIKVAKRTDTKKRRVAESVALLASGKKLGMR